MSSASKPSASRPFFYPGIRTRVTFPFLLATTMMAVISVFVVTRLVAGSVQERFNNQLLDSAQAASNTVADVERQQLTLLRTMVFTTSVDTALMEGNTAKLDEYLRPIAVNSQVDEVLVFTADGQNIFRLLRVITNEGVDYQSVPAIEISERAGVQRILTAQADVLGDKFVDIVGTPPETTLFISAPVINDAGEIVGGISLGLQAETLAQRVSEQSLSGTTLITADGQILGSTYTNSSALSLEAAAAASLLAEAQNGSPIQEHILNNATYQVLYAPFQLRSQPIGLLAVSLPSNFIVERISISRNIFALMFALLFVAIAGIGMATARSITHPVRRLVDTTRAIRAGDLSRRVSLTTPDELGELGTSFDHMTDQLIEETARREAVLTSISDAVLVQDPAGQVIMRNAAGEKLMAHAADAIQPVLSTLPLDEPHTIEIEDEFFSVLATPVRLASQQLLGHVIVFRDITALIHSERLKDELIKQMSHELRTPLGAARGYVELVMMLDNAQLQPQSQTFMQNAVDGMTTLERMINQVIDVSAIISSQFRLDTETFDLTRLIAEEIATWEADYGKRQLTLTFDPPRETIEIEGDQYRLGQVVDHLLRNAHSYTLPGGKIEVRLHKTGTQAQFTVGDTGVGIDADEIEAVFERMYRGRSADAGPTDARGLGLGLTLSKQIVEAHHGTIQLSSRPQVGTTVIVTLPLSQKADARPG